MLAKKPLTDRAIDKAKPAEAGKRKLLWDAHVPGLALRITDNGSKSFVLVTRYPGSPNPTARALGRVGAITLVEARDRARDWLKQITAGNDPAAQLAEAKAETLAAIAADYFKRKAKDLRTRDEYEATLARLAYPTLGSRPIASITRGDVVRLMDRVEDNNGASMADRVLE